MAQPDIQINPLGYGATANTPPETTPVGTNKLSIRDLFPPITSIPIEAGGIPPDRADMNGIIKYIGARLYWYQNGGIYEYSEELNYEPNNHIIYNDMLYKCIAANGPATSAGVRPPSNAGYWTAYENMISAAETSAKNYADTKDTVVLQNAKDYSDANLVIAKAYADTKGFLAGDLKAIAYDVETLDGWLLCDGSWLNREDYSDLFDAIGLTWTDQEAEEYTEEVFQIPNFTSRFLEGGTVGEYKEAGLPNITGTFAGGRSETVDTGAFRYVGAPTYLRGGGDYAVNATHDFNASRSNAIYSDDITTVQPASASIKYFIKY